MVSGPIRWAVLIGAGAVSLAWLWRGMGVAGSAASDAAAATVPMPAVVSTSAVAPMTSASASAAASAPPVPYAYVGSWREGSRLHLSLRRGTSTHSIKGLGPIDEQYVVIAADEERVTLRYLPLGTVHVIGRERQQASRTASARTPSARSDSEAQAEEN